MKIRHFLTTSLVALVFSRPTHGRVHRPRSAVLEASPSQPQTRHYSDSYSTSIKYFHEAAFDPHYDGRYADGRLPYDLHRSSLILLAQTCLTTFNDIGIETWVMHGSLLGWYWNRRILPWDSDIDLQISEKSIDHLATHYNMSTFRFRQGTSRLRRNYMLEINPNYKNSSHTDKHNYIDARWIDTDTGLFLDITVLHADEKAQKQGIDGAMMCKDGHTYQYGDIYPLRDTLFEGVPAKAPFAYPEVLIEEYQQTALSNIYFEGHQWHEEEKTWKRLGPLPQWPQNTLSSFVPRLYEAAKDPGHGHISDLARD